MIIVKLWGGMCNQMFQYAFGYALAKEHRDELCFDVDFYKNQPGHVAKRKVISQNEFPGLSMLNFSPRPSVIKFFENKYISHIIRYNFGCNFRLPGIHFMMERLRKFYDNIPYRQDVSINFYDGYWQSAKYIQKYEEEIRQEFTPSKEVQEAINKWRKSVASDNCVAVHVRRGDYLNKINNKSFKDNNVIGNVQYYLRAIDYVISKIENAVFCFFSDDIEWCRKTFESVVDKAVFVENKGKNAAILDLFSIASCEHGIMSPSTFSWWGNWLRIRKRNSIVVVPNGNYASKDFFDENWVKM